MEVIGASHKRSKQKKWMHLQNSVNWDNLYGAHDFADQYINWLKFQLKVENWWVSHSRWPFVYFQFPRITTANRFVWISLCSHSKYRKSNTINVNMDFIMNRFLGRILNWIAAGWIKKNPENSKGTHKESCMKCFIVWNYIETVGH